MTKAKSFTGLERENRELRARLREAEETLQAIRQDQVDALVIDGPKGEQIYTLEGADHPYRVMVEAMSEGAATLSTDGTLLYANRHLADMLRSPLESLLGSPLLRFISPEDHKTFAALLEQAQQQNAQNEVAFVCLDGHQLPVLLSVSTFQIRGDKGVCLVATDLTQQKLNEEIVAAERLARSILDQAAEAIVVCDAEGKIIRANQAVHEICRENPLYKPFESVLRLEVAPSDGQAFSIAAVLQGHLFRGLEARLECAPDSKLGHAGCTNWLLSAAPLHRPDQETIGCIITLTDITERKRAQEELRRARDELATLLQVTHSMASTLEMGPLLSLILDQLRIVADYTGATVYELEDDALTELAYGGPPSQHQDSAPIHFPLSGAPVHRRVVETRQPLLIADVSADAPEATELRESGIVELRERLLYARSWVGVPLVVQQRVIGMLVMRHTDPNYYNAHHAELALAFANQAALAIENARLYEQAQELAVLQERQRLARDLHDAVSQSLFTATLLSEVLPRIWERDQTEGRRRLLELHRLARGALAEMRMLLIELRPAALVDLSLNELIKQLADAMSGKSRLKVVARIEGQSSLVPDVKVALYRIAQEALGNVVKHAEATEATLDLRYIALADGAPATDVELRIADNGRGFESQTFSADHMGLRIMRERAEAISAKLSIESQIGEGTCVTVNWPAQAQVEPRE